LPRTLPPMRRIVKGPTNMPDSKDPKDNPLNNFLENPITIGAMILIALIGAGTGMLDSWYALVLVGIGIFGIFRAIKKRNEDRQ
jgi:hypothetical protein